MRDYRTFAELARGEAGREELARLLADAAPSIPVASAVRSHLIRMGRADVLTVADFCTREDLHRRLKSIVPLPALIRAVSEYLEGKAARVQAPKMIETEVKAYEHVTLLVGAREFRFIVDPLQSGAALGPGEGAQTSVQTEGTVRRFAHRRFELELESARAATKTLGLEPASAWPTMKHLTLINELQKSSRVKVRFAPDAPRFVPVTGRSALTLRAQPSGVDWFSLDGWLEMGDLRVPLSTLLDAPPNEWLMVAPNVFAPVTDELSHTLEALRRLRGAQGVSRAVAPWLVELGALTRPESAEAPPASFTAVLRPYQLEGFRWLARMASLTTGAVLADDMGLGKTVQAIALLAHRAPLGKALVVAPSSVTSMWKYELKRFAPGLESQVDITTWSLLARAVPSQRFATVILDEAQSLKNAQTQRAAAAFALDAQFVVALTGTPIENHLREVWSLFHATVPALFGTERSFAERFLGGDSAKALATVVAPFMLRRTKAQVAPELPARTEQTLLIELSEEERALTESLRREALAASGGNTMSALAALTRLRLAACHPRLVDPAWSGTASKLAALRVLVATLTDEGHKVLVFSQFTKHLALVREGLEADGVTLSYLDGATPRDERARRVLDFQEGRGGEVFLISLKAGGTGLTLTAADEVIHLDPWWNPAVEDQASDRAHRIGQTKPVTSYRLIAQGTVEEKMLVLHANKRALVDAVLNGSTASSPLTHDDIIELLRR